MMASWVRRGYMALVALFLAAPLAVVAGVSVNEKKTLLFPPRGFSLEWYAAVFTEREWRDALIASVGLAVLSAALAVIVALPLSWFFWRRIAPWARVFQVLGVAPFMLPPVITALGFLSFWATGGGLRRAVDGCCQPRDFLRDPAVRDDFPGLFFHRPIIGRSSGNHGCR